MQNDQTSGNDSEGSRFAELDRQAGAKGYGDEMHGYKVVKGLREHLLSGSRASRAYASLTRAARDHGNVAQERPPLVPGSVLKSRLVESKGEATNARKSR
ncbi:hypothetical protein V6N13_048818 [Hibiscus sabdariffa]